jgi:hypothetical protein
MHVDARDWQTVNNYPPIPVLGTHGVYFCKHAAWE